jgi:hypothetical protein
MLHPSRLQILDGGYIHYLLGLPCVAVVGHVLYLTIIETKDRSLEELEEIFNGPDKARMSMQKRRLF